VSSTARNSPSSIYSRILNAAIGARLKPIEGYDGSQACLMALERGEVDAHVSGGSSAPFRARIAPWLGRGDTKVIMQMGMARDTAFPDVPTALEVVLTAGDRQLFEIAFAEQVMGRPFVLPPGVPGDRVTALRFAFDATMKDAAFLDDAKLQHAEINSIGGQDIHALLERVYSAPPGVIARLRELAK
jgi:tripartite-type tricarboxylate transporter receptor subunit TctC